MASRKWSELTTGQQRAVYVAGAIETIVTVAALRDLGRRPASAVRGPKVLWRLGAFVQPVGPVAYFAAGRRSP